MPRRVRHDKRRRLALSVDSGSVLDVLYELRAGTELALVEGFVADAEALDPEVGAECRRVLETWRRGGLRSGRAPVNDNQKGEW